jgi:hypothetical protein
MEENRFILCTCDRYYSANLEKKYQGMQKQYTNQADSAETRTDQ